MHSLIQHKLKGFTSNRVTPCTLQNSQSCTSPLAVCLTQQESRPLKHWVKSCLGLLFCFVLFSPVRKIHSYLSRLVILIVSITWNNLEGGVPGGDLPKCALKTVLLGRLLRCKYCFATIWRSFSHCMEITKTHPRITHCLLAFCCHKFISIVLCKDF